MTNIQEIIQELQEEFAKSKNVFWSKKSLINLDKCEDLIIELKRSLPSSVQEATYIVTQKEKILAQANDIAKNTIAEAEKRAEILISDSEIVKKAEKEAKDIQQKVDIKCSAMVSNTKDNIDKMLKAIEDYLVDNLHIVRNNREELAGALLTKKPKIDSEN